MNKEVLRNVMTDCLEDAKAAEMVMRDVEFDDALNYVCTGLRRAGKSYVFYQRMRQLVSNGYDWSDFLYVKFEDERLTELSSADLNLLEEIHLEKYGKKPIMFLDELQNIEGWEKYARRLADSKHRVYITGSNAKALSREIQTTLGGRYIDRNIYPYSFAEYLRACGVQTSADSFDSTAQRAEINRHLSLYLRYGGLPEVQSVKSKRELLSSIYQKVYLGDIAARHKIENITVLRIMLKKLTETVTKPVSFTRLKNILSGIGINIGTQTVINYLDYTKDAWLILPLENYASKFVEKESVKKYYFSDNGILNLFYTENNSALLENMVAVSLFRKFGTNPENPAVWFFGTPDCEIDFYIPGENAAIQVCWQLSDDDTIQREIRALASKRDKLNLEKAIIVTYEDEGELTAGGMNVPVVPLSRWMLTL